ncbi:hypothetical protein [Flavobacterium sp.]|uniref:ImuA family protein n=1 Tax=Flavobacterium sp. TaxID=239 RepID=UPI00261EA13A|nr:hypothetical protein [Flavobacterium sp.]
MLPNIEKREIAKQLQAKINAMQGLGKPLAGLSETGLFPFTRAFPGNIFPMGAIHEFVSYEQAHRASTSGFISALAGKLIKDEGLCLWIGSDGEIFPSGLKYFGLEPDRIIFINTSKPKDLLWVIEETLKCEAIAVLIGEIKNLGFTESRRLQLAVERSGVTGFIHRYQPFRENAVACTTRWKVTPLASVAIDGLPGVGRCSWDIQLLKVKNGRPDSWQVSWSDGTFLSLSDVRDTIQWHPERHAG